jgi:hypothetical protein
VTGHIVDTHCHCFVAVAFGFLLPISTLLMLGGMESCIFLDFVLSFTTRTYRYFVVRTLNLVLSLFVLILTHLQSFRLHKVRNLLMSNICLGIATLSKNCSIRSDETCSSVLERLQENCWRHTLYSWATQYYAIGEGGNVV